MANATAKVNRAFRRVQDDILTHSWTTLTAALQLYTGAMVGISPTTSYLLKFDDTVSLRFFGLVLEDGGNPKLPIGTQGDGTLDLDVKRPAAFELNIASVAITDIGRRVYALDDQTGTLDSSATTFCNLIGTVKDLIYAADRTTPVANYALVEPIYTLPWGQQLQVVTASGVVQIKQSTVVITKSSAAALTMADPTTGVHDGLEMTFISQTAQAHTLITPSGYNQSGTQALWGGARGDGFTIIAFAGKWYVKFKTNISLS